MTKSTASDTQTTRVRGTGKLSAGTARVSVRLTARKERAKFLAEFDITGVNPIERDKVTIGDLVDTYLEWGRSEGKYVDRHYSQYNAHLKNKIHALPVVELTPNLLPVSRRSS